MPRAIWKRILDASKAEALLAVDIYNRPRHERRVEGYFVHMHLAWLYLLQARFHRDGIDYRHRKPGSNRFERVDGEPKTWGLSKCVGEHWPDESHPVRLNLELTVALRNKIEHRFTDAELDIATSGYAQATLLNYESELTDLFGEDESLADALRFPVFVGTFSNVSADRMRMAKTALPAEVRNFISGFQANFGDDVVEDSRYEFRVHLIQQTGPKTDADVSLNFVREDELTQEQHEVLAGLGREGTLIVREQSRPVASAGLLKPGQVVKRVGAQVPFVFNMRHFIHAWRHLKVRPEPGAKQPQRTIEKYCVYDQPHRDYLYTDAFVDKLVREAKTASGFKKLTGLDPRPAGS